MQLYSCMQLYLSIVSSYACKSGLAILYGTFVKELVSCTACIQGLSCAIGIDQRKAPGCLLPAYLLVL